MMDDNKKFVIRCRAIILHEGRLLLVRHPNDSEIKEALGIIYKTDALKSKVTELINQLIEKGSSVFWGLKDVLY